VGTAIAETRYDIPTGDGRSKMSIDLVGIAIAEQRLQDVATVNQHTAPELLKVYNEAWLDLNKTVACLTREKNKAEAACTRASAEAKMKCTDAAIQAKGHSKASADLRKAFVDLDSDVVECKERVDEISFVLDIVKGKMQAFFNAYNSVKRLTEQRLPPPSYSSSSSPRPYQSPPPPQQVSTAPIDPDFEPLPPGFRAI
jgi:hypothetical protein